MSISQLYNDLKLRIQEIDGVEKILFRNREGKHYMTVKVNDYVAREKVRKCVSSYPRAIMTSCGLYDATFRLNRND